ncbi:MAG TPA: 2-succinyl-5-enolpyruvyl-6-hydroxy-3-cyclohexene-1-carboxylic-acid synthase, partial [Candidatus Acidoferrales bacterium]|nr:2-succinyl-5-enolpyruvyl-6-hydroxy-3-cyclohexene-1-carboxylic-acid synthase [Candidatus Acidoferrales bacterium]
MDVAQSFAATFVDELAAQGLEHACVSPGSRSAPLAMALARHPGIHVFMQVDERSGSFFALGLAKATGRPVALLCTSGTAAAEFHPAVVEGFHSRTPLLVLTADRPPELRGVGANQAIDQARIYGGAVRWSFDPGPPTETEPGLWRRLAARALAEATGPPAGPVHLNLPFREPLTPEPGRPPAPLPAPSPRIATGPRAAVGAKELAAALVAAERPLVVAGELRPGQRLAEPLGRLLQLSGAALFAEPSSQLRRAGLPGLVEAYEPLIRVPRWAAAHQPDLVLRLGATPTSRPLNEWLAQAAPRTFLIDPDAAWLDPDHAATDVLRCDEMALLEDVLPSLRK